MRLPTAVRPALPVLAPLLLLCVGGITSWQAAAAAESGSGRLVRTDCNRVFFPLASDGAEARTGDDADWLSRARQSAEASDEQQAFVSLLRAHHANPANVDVRRMLALPADRSVAVTIRRGRSAPPPPLRWQAGRFLRAQTPHFMIYSAAGAERTQQVAAELERFYWIWAQMFFPLWEGRDDVGRALQGGPAIGRSNRLLRVVLFADHASYISTLRPHVPTIGQSTGFYSDTLRTTYLIDGDAPEELATRHHELTHQLLREATGSQLRGASLPGESSDFWLIEGVASYMESLRLAPTYGWVGGWESPRLQFARYRWLVGGDPQRLTEIAAQGRLQVQQRDDLPRWYSYAAAYTHLLIDGGNGAQREALFGRLQQLYATGVRGAERPSPPIDLEAASAAMDAFLRLDDAALQTPDPAVPLSVLCLGRTAVTAAGLARIAPQRQLSWLDLSQLPVTTAEIHHLLFDADHLRQLNLEATAVDDAVVDLLRGAEQLRELDLSLTAVTDACVEQLAHPDAVETLWLTGTQVTDATARRLIAGYPALRSVDLQRTAVTPAAVAQLEQARPTLQVNPLTLVEPSTPAASDAP